MFQKVFCVLMLGSFVIMSGQLSAVNANDNNPSQKYIKVDVKRRPSSKQWIQYDTRTIDMLAGFEPYKEKIKLDSYGGRSDRQANATGFFYPKKVGDRWWLVDPDGNLFIHTAIVGVYMGKSDFSRKISLKHFGTQEKWAQFSAELLSDYGFNGSGGWSQAHLLRKTKKPPAFLHVLSGETLKQHKYYYVRYVGGKWKKTPITFSNHQWNSCYITDGASGSLDAYIITGQEYLTEKGYMDRHGGGQIEQWTSEDDGNSWKKVRDITPDKTKYAGWKFNNIQPVKKPDGTIVENMLLFYGWKESNAPTAKAFLLHE